jgi:integrase
MGRYSTVDPAPRFHDLRHAGVKMAIQAGAHSKTIQTWVRHSSNVTTMNVYGHLFEGAEAELTEKLGDLREAAREEAK